MNVLVRLALTLSYVTCFHVITVDYDSDEEVLRGLAKYLPAAGVLIGACLWAGNLLLAYALSPPLVAGAISTILWFVLTSGLHLDGLMDAADGIFSHRSQERMLEIMSDPRVGNFGVIIGVLLLLTKFATLTSLYIHSLWVVLLLIAAWARLAEVYAIGKFKYAKEQGKGKVWHDSTQYPRDLFLSAIAPIAITSVAMILAPSHQSTIVAAGAATVLTGVVAAHWLNHKLGGQTGDTYGCVVEVAEAGGLLIAAMLIN